MTSYTKEYLKKIDDHNKERYDSWCRILDRIGTGVECPSCGEELIETHPGVILTSNPPQKLVHCPKCEYKNSILA